MRNPFKRKRYRRSYGPIAAGGSPWPKDVPFPPGPKGPSPSGIKPRPYYPGATGPTEYVSPPAPPRTPKNGGIGVQKSLSHAGFHENPAPPVGASGTSAGSGARKKETIEVTPELLRQMSGEFDELVSVIEGVLEDLASPFLRANLGSHYYEATIRPWSYHIAKAVREELNKQ